MNRFEQYVPHMHNIFWMVLASVVLWKLSQFIDAALEAISEPGIDGKRGKVSIKRTIPFIFAILVCYMVVGSMHTGKTGKEFNSTAFWGLLFYIALATTVITYAQATGLLDKINLFKGNVQRGANTNTDNAGTDNSGDKSQTERRNDV